MNKVVSKEEKSLKSIDYKAKWKIAHKINVIGLMNVQLALKDNQLYVLEVNPRASRTVPFVSKAKGIPLARIASRIMAGERLSKLVNL